MENPPKQVINPPNEKMPQKEIKYEAELQVSQMVQRSIDIRNQSKINIHRKLSMYRRHLAEKRFLDPSYIEFCKLQEKKRVENLQADRDLRNGGSLSEEKVSELKQRIDDYQLVSTSSNLDQFLKSQEEYIIQERQMINQLFMQKAKT